MIIYLFIYFVLFWSESELNQVRKEIIVIIVLVIFRNLDAAV